MASQQAKLTKWFEDHAPPRLSRLSEPRSSCRRKYAICLGDPLALKSWERGGHKTLSKTIENEPLRIRELLQQFGGKLALAMAFPPCVDLCAAGARWWKKKREENPNFQLDAVERLKKTEQMLRSTGAPYCILTPGSVLIKKLWKDPDATISPFEFGGYLPENAAHPTHPNAIPKRDAYHKLTFVFSGNGFVLPRRKPVPPKWHRVVNKKTGKVRLVSPIFAARKHRAARKLAPLGFCEAVCRLHFPCAA